MTSDEQKILEQVNAFYERYPFPGFDLRKYSYPDDLRRQASWFGQLLDAQIPYHAKILDAGCGTGQLANFLALKDRKTVGIDFSQRSLDYAIALKEKLAIPDVTFARASVLEIDWQDEFDYVLCLGVLHHTSNPYQGFRNLTQAAKPGGFIILGLYNTWGRLPVRLRRGVKKLFRGSRIQEKAVQRQLGDQEAEPEKSETWLADQYYHPHESSHSISDVLDWLKLNHVQYVNSVPPIEWFRNMKRNHRILKPSSVASWRRYRLPLIFVQMKWIFSLRDNGGYFVIIGRKYKN